MAIPEAQLTYKTTSRQYLDREGLIEYTNKIKSKIAEDITADLGKKITAESEARAAGDSALQQSIDNLPAKAYSKITAVSGSTTTVIEASGKDNELKLKAGSNVALGVDTTNKAITINATDTKYSAATTTAPGLMSAADKVKLDGIATNANKYTLPPATSTTLGGVMVPADSGIELSSDGKIKLTKDKLVQVIGAFTGATASTAGQVGLVPAPTKGSTSLYLKSDGTWGTPTNTNTTYTLSPGTNNGTLKLTPSSGSAQDNIKVTGLGNLAYENSLSASDVGALSAGADYIARATVNGNTLTLSPNGKTAVTFTNSVYDKFIGATATTAGQAGLVPAPAKASTSLYLKSDGTWGTPPDTVYTHPNSKVEAGTYRSVTVDAQGHVTEGTNPTTLDKYGITDAKIVNGPITLGTATITPLTSSSVTVTNNTASWGHPVVVGKVGGKDLEFEMPANPNTWRSIKVNTDTTISASTLNLVAGTNIALTTTTSGSVANVTIATSGLGTAATKSADTFATADHKHSNYASSVETTGTGNAITTIAQSGNKITATKGTTFLTSHQAVTTSNPTATFGDPVVVGKVGGTELKFTMPANPDTKYTAGSGLSLSGTTFSANGSAIINALGEGTAEANREDYIVAQYAGGGTTTTSYHRRKLFNVFAALNKADIIAALGYTPPTTNTNTWRSIQVNGVDKLTDSSTKLNLKAGSNVTLEYASGTVTIGASSDDLSWKTSKADESDLTTHTGNNTVHITAAERTKWNNAAAGDLRALANTWQQKQSYSAAGTVEAGSTSGSGAINVTAGGIWAAGGILGNKVYNAVWNDLADCIPVDDDVELEPGRCYCFNGTNYHKSSKYLADGIIGIHSDTYGMHMGAKQGVKQMDVAVAGFVLAYVDQEYPVGTPLTCGPDGMLVKIEREDKIEYPEKIIATYWKKEPEEYWGSETQKVKVNGRKWVKIK